MSSTALEILDSLEWRLRRVEFWLHGGDDTQNDNNTEQQQQQPEGSLNTRLERLERKLDELSHHSQPAATLLELSTRLPEIFKSPSTTLVSAETDELHTSTGYKTSIILSSASQFSVTVTQLSAVKDNAIPERADELASVVSLQPRLKVAQEVQLSQEAEVRRSRDRSAALLGEWYERQVLVDGEDWAVVEERMRGVEQAVRRVERERNEES